MNIPWRIQELRKQKGVSQEELANAIGVSRQAVSKWESAQSNPEIDNIIALSDFFGVSTDQILKGVKEDNAPAGEKAEEKTDEKNTAVNIEEETIFSEKTYSPSKKCISVMLMAGSVILSLLGTALFFIYYSFPFEFRSIFAFAALTAVTAAIIMFIFGSGMLSKMKRYKALCFAVKYLNSSTVIYVLMTFILEQVVQVDLWPRGLQFTAVFFFIAAIGGISLYLYRMIQSKRTERASDDISSEIPAQENAQ